MRIPIDDELRKICKAIVFENKTTAEWAAIESDDMFQDGAFVGGYDADEEAFCFSYFRDDEEYWFQASLEEVASIAAGDNVDLDGREAE